MNRPAATYSNGTGDACVCGLGGGTASPPCPLHPPRHSPYGREATAEPADLGLIEAAGDHWSAFALDPAAVEAAWREWSVAIVSDPGIAAAAPSSGHALASLYATEPHR